ncbi:MAG: Xaa-Pro peptidase family protein [Candidatus Omnitrophica bacterium]|nr:Xaa-Pro peptidase family protein [Candidatus Omnitrophota bacterium]
MQEISREFTVTSRLKKIYTKLLQKNLDALLVSCPSNITYLTGYPSRDSYLLVSKEQNFYITDSRYVEEAKTRLKGIAAVTKSQFNVFKTITHLCRDIRIKQLGFEERHLTYAEYKKIDEEIDKNTHLIPTRNIIEEERQIKDKEELIKIRKAIQITVEAMCFIERFGLADRTELEVAAELERFIRYKGASTSAFEIIVASGLNSSFPHHITSSKRIRDDEPVLIDMGVDYYGYKSDLTRIFLPDKINFLFRKIYRIAREAQDKAIAKIRPEVRISQIDNAARSLISLKGYGRFFGHNLGHGVGLEVHEDPHISCRTHEILKPGMVFTVEPGIYLPNKFGVRIEDMVLVTQKGVEVLSGSLNK